MPVPKQHSLYFLRGAIYRKSIIFYKLHLDCRKAFNLDTPRDGTVLNYCSAFSETILQPDILLK